MAKPFYDFSLFFIILRTGVIEQPNTFAIALALRPFALSSKLTSYLLFIY